MIFLEKLGIVVLRSAYSIHTAMNLIAQKRKKSR